MKPGDLVCVVRTINRENVWTVGVLIRRETSDADWPFYDVLLDGKIELTHEMNIKILGDQ
jgi:hypothetical protein